jgi:LysM repeat protein
MTSEHGSEGEGSSPASGQAALAPSPDWSVDIGSSGAADPEASAPGPARPGAALSGRATAAVMCPFLATESGAWRAAFPVGDHRCTAVVPAVRIAPAKQRRLCLTADHAGCATYVAALELRGPAVGGGAAARTAGTGRRRAIPATTPVLLERIRPALPIPATMQRGIGQVVLVGLLAIAFLAVFFARLGSAPAAASPSPSASAAAASGASLSPSPRPGATPVSSASPSAPAPSPSPTAAPSGSPRQTARPSARPSPSGSLPPASGTYTVKFGDTLSGIAGQYGITVKALAQLNGLSGPPYAPIHPGQVLKVP